MVCVQSSGHGMVGLSFGRVTCGLIDPVSSIWYGVQASIGGSCVKVMLRAIWPSINDIRQSSRPRPLALPRTHDIIKPMASPNLRESLHGTFYVSSSSPSSLCPQFGSRSTRCRFSPRVDRQITNIFLKSRHLFTLKAIVAPTAGITFFVWCIVRAHGIGPTVKQPAQIHGSDLGWAMVFSLMSCISNMATLVTCVILSPCLT